MPQVSFAIQAHPLRTEMAGALARRIGGEVEVVMDPDPDAPFRSPWRTFRHLFLTTPPGATHRAQMQDDALPCDGYRRAVEAAVEVVPDRLLVFFVAGTPYMHKSKVLDACQRDETWAELYTGGVWCPVIATCWPVEMALDMVEWNDAQGFPEKFVSDDERVGRYLDASGHKPWASVPSLVEHEDVVASLIGRRNMAGEDPDRVAACFIGVDCGCVDEIDWHRFPGSHQADLEANAGAARVVR